MIRGVTSKAAWEAHCSSYGEYLSSLSYLPYHLVLGCLVRRSVHISNVAILPVATREVHTAFDYVVLLETVLGVLCSF